MLMAYLQRVVNGAGLDEREYDVGRDRNHLLVRRPRGPRRWRVTLSPTTTSKGHRVLLLHT